jgi:predicted nucleic acid-binding protein
VIVVDAAALTNAFTDDGSLGETARGELAGDDRWAAPEHVFVEVVSAVRGRLLGGKIGLHRAREAIDALAEASIDTVSTQPLAHRIWELRENLTAYDAGYVAAAEANGCALVTADARLGRASGVHCPVRVITPRRPGG